MPIIPVPACFQPHYLARVAAWVARLAAGLTLTSLALTACQRPAPQAAATTAATTAGATAPAVALPAAASPTGVTPGGALRAVAAVAVVNGAEISAERFNAEFEKLAGPNARVASDRIQHMAKSVLNRLIDQTLREQAIAEQQLSLTDAEMDEAWREFSARFVDERGEIDKRRLEAELGRSRTSVDAMRAQIRDQRLSRKLVERLGKIEISEADIKAFYDNNPSAWMEADSRDVRPIIIAIPAEPKPEDITKAQAKAKEAQEALAKGGDFETLAKTYSGSVPAPIHIVQSGGQTELEKAAFALKVGEVSQPIRTRWGFYVLRLIEKNDKRVRSFAEVRDEIRKTLVIRHSHMEERRILAELRRKAQIIEKLPF